MFSPLHVYHLKLFTISVLTAKDRKQVQLNSNNIRRLNKVCSKNYAVTPELVSTRTINSRYRYAKNQISLQVTQFNHFKGRIQLCLFRRYP